jgi:hypothetical protein
MVAKKTKDNNINEILPSDMIHRSLSFLSQVELRMATMCVCKYWVTIGSEVIRLTDYDQMNYRALCFNRYGMDVVKVERVLRERHFANYPKDKRLLDNKWRFFYNTCIFMESVVRDTPWLKENLPKQTSKRETSLQYLMVAYRYIRYEFKHVPQPRSPLSTWFYIMGYRHHRKEMVSDRHHRKEWYQNVKNECERINRQEKIIDIDQWLTGIQDIEYVNYTHA